jgi:hypothetical protein
VNADTYRGVSIGGVITVAVGIVRLFIDFESPLGWILIAHRANCSVLVVKTT